jgi:cbb3-type cytochrome oxidase maturation protein
MEILLLLLPLSIVLVFVIGAAFWWSVGSGQFDDLDSPAYRVVADEDRIVSSVHEHGRPMESR